MPKETVAELQARLQALATIEEKTEAINKLDREQLEALKAILTLESDIQLAVHTRLADQEKSVDYLRQQVSAADDLLKKYQATAKMGDSGLLVLEQTHHLRQLELQQLKQKIKEGKLGAAQATKELENYKKREMQARLAVEHAAQLTVSLEDSVTAAKGLGTAMGSAVNVFGSNAVAKVDMFRKAMLGGTASMYEAFMQINQAVTVSLLNNFVGLAIQLVDTEAGFRKATGASREFATGVTRVYKANRAYGVTAEEASAATQALFTDFTDFTMQGEATRDMLAGTAAILGDLGVANADFAKGVQLSTKALGMNAAMAERTQRELATFGQDLGVSPAQMAKDFAGAGNAMAKMGSDGVKAFKDLAHVSKITGMEVQKLLNITDKFDTFEGAAEQAGKLNAAIGGNFVNAMDLMLTTDPAERFGMIRDSILDAGLTFDDMSYYQKNFYKDALGLSDVGDLAMMLSGNMDNLAGVTQKSAKDLIELKENAASVQKVQEKWTAAMANAAPIAEDLIDKIITLTDWMAENEGKTKLIIYGMGLLGVAMAAINLRYKFMAVKSAAMVTKLITETAVRKTLVEVMEDEGDALDDINTKGGGFKQTLDDLGASATRNAKGLLAVGGAVLMIGAGIAIAAWGVAQLVLSFQGLGDAAWPAAAAVIGFTAGFLLMVVVLANAAPIIGAAGVGLLYFGGALALVGLGAMLAGAGVSLVGKGFSLMVTAINLLETDKAAYFIGLFVTLGFMSVALMLASKGLIVLAAAIGLMALAVAFMDVEKMKAFTGFLTSITGLGELTHLKALREEIRGIVKELDAVDPEKTLSFAVSMGTVADLNRVNAAMSGRATAGTVSTIENIRTIIDGTQAPAPAAAAGGRGGGVRTRQPIELVVDRDRFGKVVLEIVGDKVMAVNNGGAGKGIFGG